MRPLAPEELAFLLVKEALLPLHQEYPILDADDPLRAAATAESLEPVRRRQFLCEKVETSYRQLLAAATDGLDKERARVALNQTVEANLHWARKNIVGFGTGHAEYTLFVRIQELSAHYQKALQALGRPESPATLEDVSATVNALHTKADAIRSDTNHLRTAIPAAIERQAGTIRDQASEIDRLKMALAKRLDAMAEVFSRINANDMRIFLTFMHSDTQKKAAESLEIKESTLRARVAKWPFLGPAYRQLHELYRWRKESDWSPTEVPYFENLFVEKKAAPDVDCHLLIDIAEIIGDMTPANLEAKRAVLLNKYLKEYLAT